VLVLNSAQLQPHLLQARSAKPLDAARVERAAALLEDRCRNVKPAYRPDDDE
jgi:hypothetical protein